jgi:hypothetical protein
MPIEPGTFEYILAKIAFESDYDIDDETARAIAERLASLKDVSIEDVDEYWGKPAEELPMRLWYVNEDGEIENPFWYHLKGVNDEKA